jgi:glycosyltransferase involved in cell wall biosynthesis
MNKVSIIMGVYNEETNIGEAIESIIKQSYSCWEFVIVDDCSEDSTRQIVEKFCSLDSRIKLYKNKKNLGLAQSLNKAISNSSGIYIARMDADDISLPNRLEEQVKILDTKSNISVVGTAAYNIEGGNIRGRAVKMPQFHHEIIKNIFKMSPFIHPSVMMRKEFLSLTNGYSANLRRAQDYDLWLRGRFIGEYYNIQEPLILYSYQNKFLFTGFVNSVQIRLKNSSNAVDIFKSIYWSCYEAIYILSIIFTKIFFRNK